MLSKLLPQMIRAAVTLLAATLQAAAADGGPQQLPAVSGDRVTVRALTVQLPPDQAWRLRQIAVGQGGTLHEAERDLPGGNLAQVHVADSLGPAHELPLQLIWSGLGDSMRLLAFIGSTEDALAAADKPLESSWVQTQRGPQRRYGAACRELHWVREDRERKDARYLWRDWMLFCIDPISHLPVQIDYAERYRADAGGPGAAFEADAEAFFDGLEFARGEQPARPSAETPAAMIMANSMLFGNADNEDYPAAVVFSLDPAVGAQQLRDIAQRVGRLKGTSPSDPHEAAIARQLTSEKAHFTSFMQVPPAIARSDRVFLGSIVIKRVLLPKGRFGPGSGYGDFILQVLVHPTSEFAYQIEHVGIHSLKP